MFYDLRAMDLGDWHPREIPEALLRNPALQEQQGHTLPPWEQWYVMLLHNGKLPGALTKRPNTAFTNSLLASAREGAALALGSDRGSAARLPDRSEKTWDHLHEVSHRPRKRLVIPAARGMPQGMGANLRHRQVGQSRQGVGHGGGWDVRMEGMEAKWRV